MWRVILADCARIDGPVYHEFCARGAGLRIGHSVNRAPSNGGYRLIASGFSDNSRTQVEAWTEHARKTWGAGERFMRYQVPMIGGFGRIGRPFITGGLRKETPAQYHGNAVTVFGGVGPWKTWHGALAACRPVRCREGRGAQRPRARAPRTGCEPPKRSNIPA